MRLAALYSGGKDSTYAIQLARASHEVACLLTVHPASAESPLFHHPNSRWTALQAEAMGLPQLESHAHSCGEHDELRELASLARRAKSEFGVEGVVHGGIRSAFQRARFESACGKAGLAAVSPLWGREAAPYMSELLGAGTGFCITSVSAGGLGEEWLGREVTAGDLPVLGRAAAKHGFNMDFEGGEAETFATDSAIFSRPIRITGAKKAWDGYRGRLEILGAELDRDA